MKITIAALLLLFSLAGLADTTLFLFGGGARPVGALQEFVKASGGDQGRFLVIPWASEDNEGAENIQKDLAKLTRAKIDIISNNASQVEKQISDATGIFFAGGDQVKAMEIMKSFSVKSLLQKRFADGVAFAGTSAGTAIMSQRMITGEGDFTVIDGKAVEVSEGLGLLPYEVIVDQHFVIRSRFNRLAGVVLSTKALGIGVDENNALVIYNNTSAKLFGETEALFFTPENAQKLSIDLFKKNDFIDLKKYPAFQ